MASPTRLRLAVAGTLAAMVVVASVALWPRGDDPPPAAGRTLQGVPTTRPPAPVTGPSPSPSTAASVRSPTPTPTRSATPGPPVTYEAEAADLGGSARVTKYRGASGGRIVQNIGAWDQLGDAGTVRFTVTAPAPGRYSLTFFYVYLNGDTSRSVVITVSGAGPVTLNTQGGSSCCAAMTTVIALQTGPSAITFTNPAGPAPSLDKIVIQPR